MFRGDFITNLVRRGAGLKSTNIVQPSPALYFPSEISKKVNPAPEEMAEPEALSIPEERGDYLTQTIVSRNRDSGIERSNELIEGASAESHKIIGATSRVHSAGIETASISHPIVPEEQPWLGPEEVLSLVARDSDRKPEALIQFEARRDEGETWTDLPRSEAAARELRVSETVTHTQTLDGITAISKQAISNPPPTSDLSMVHNISVNENQNLTSNSKSSDGAIPMIKPMPIKRYAFSKPRKETSQSDEGGPVNISIGTIEVRAETTPPPAPPSVKPETYGFEGYELIRSYISWER